MSFVLDPRLAADTHKIADLGLCYVGLMDDRRFTWFILVPRVEGLVEIVDLSKDDRLRLWQEVEVCCDVLKSHYPHCKLNVGALGNIVNQLHIHVIARFEGDAAWPGPAWGAGTAENYEGADVAKTVMMFRDRLDVSN